MAGRPGCVLASGPFDLRRAFDPSPLGIFFALLYPVTAGELKNWLSRCPAAATAQRIFWWAMVAFIGLTRSWQG